MKEMQVAIIDNSLIAINTQTGSAAAEISIMRREIVWRI
jgi:hypothetical protein